MSILDDLGAAWTAFKDSRTNRSDLRVYNQQNRPDVLYSNMWQFITSLVGKDSEIPRRGTYAYQLWLDSIWKEEPILAGAVYSMEAKMQAMTWTVEGGRNNAGAASRMLARAQYMNGNDWSGFIGSSAVDFYTQDGGVWWQAVREDGQWSRMVDLAHIDTLCCIPTGSTAVPMLYRSALTDEVRWFKAGEFIHFVSLPMPREKDLGVGFCAVSRAARAAKLLMALHDYDAEKLSNLPPEGVAAVTGLTMQEFMDALRLWKAERERNNSLTFPQVLWLIGNNPGAKVSVDIQAFSTIPESFDRKTVVDQYVNTLALCFGVDAREFWAISTAALGSAAETEVQHMKARGKGGGEFISLVERSLNAEMPPDATFAFDTQDIEEDMVAANIAKTWIDAYISLLYPPTRMEGAEPAIDARTFKRLLAEKGVLPEWAVGDQMVSIDSDAVHKDMVEDWVRFIWQDGGRLIERKLIDATQHRRLPEPSMKQLPEETSAAAPNIRGTPIADDEVERGTRLTSTAVKNEMAIWGSIPELAEYVPDQYRTA